MVISSSSVIMFYSAWHVHDCHILWCHEMFCSIYFCCLKVCIMNLFSALLYFSPSMRICYNLQSCLDECHWSRGYMEMLSNHVLLCLTCALIPCFFLLFSYNVASLFHASNMSTCYSWTHVCPVFSVLICVIKLLFALISLD